jgi:hypothetical protein
MPTLGVGDSICPKSDPLLSSVTVGYRGAKISGCEVFRHRGHSRET